MPCLPQLLSPHADLALPPASISPNTEYGKLFDRLLLEV